MIIPLLILPAIYGLITLRLIAVFRNILPALLGDQVYNLSIRCFGYIISPQAHYTIPWILRVPQVYVVTSIISYGLIGSVIQLIYNRRWEVKGGGEIP